MFILELRSRHQEPFMLTPMFISIAASNGVVRIHNDNPQSITKLIGASSAAATGSGIPFTSTMVIRYYRYSVLQEITMVICILQMVITTSFGTHKRMG